MKKIRGKGQCFCFVWSLSLGTKLKSNSNLNVKLQLCEISKPNSNIIYSKRLLFYQRYNILKPMNKLDSKSKIEKQFKRKRKKKGTNKQINKN